MPPAPRPLLCRVESPDQIARAFHLAAAQNRPLLLWSAPDAVRWYGVRWLRLAAAEAACPGVAWRCVLDCGDAPGLALAALQDGQRDIALSPALPATTLERLRAIADSLGATLHAAPPEAETAADAADAPQND